MLSVDKTFHSLVNSLHSRRRRSISHGSGLIKKSNFANLHQRRKSSPGQISPHVFSRLLQRHDRQCKSKFTKH